MIGHPSSATKGRDGNMLERVVAEANLGAETPERAGTAPLLGFAGGRHDPCGRPAGILAETAEAAGRLTQAGVVYTYHPTPSRTSTVRSSYGPVHSGTSTMNDGVRTLAMAALLLNVTPVRHLLTRPGRAWIALPHG